MKRLFTLIALLPLAALASPPEWAQNDKGNNAQGGDASALAVAGAEAEARSTSLSAASATQGQLQGQAQGQLQGQTATGGSATSEGSSASATTGASSAAVGNTTATVGNVGASVGAVVESGALQTSTNVSTNYREAAQGVALVITSACGEGSSGSGRDFTVAVSKGQDAFCKELALTRVYLDLGQNERAMQHLDRAEQLSQIDSFFDNFLTILSLGLLK